MTPQDSEQTDDVHFEILPYDRHNLAEALSNQFIPKSTLLKAGQLLPEDPHAPPVKEVVRFMQGGNHYNFPYLLSYLGEGEGGLRARTILVEKDYVSRAYMGDYISYYASCKQRYAKVCKRVHFFSREYSREEIRNWILGRPTDMPDPADHYLGYVVVRPIPYSFMGATLLKPFSTNEGLRHYRALRPYQINLWGKVLKLETLAFQAQDKATAACASTSLWSAFHQTSHLFDTPCPAPSEITTYSGNLFTSEGRSFPNSGLDHHQVCKAIEQVGLVSELRNKFTGWDLQVTKGFIYGYLRMGLPILLGIDILEAEMHLVTITGYRKLPLKTIRKKGFNLVSDSIERFYAHDDQIGPFSRIAMKQMEAGSNRVAGINIETSWPRKGGFQERLDANLMSLTVPVHSKIRIRYEEVYQLVARLDGILDQGGTNNIWDIFLDTSNQLKTEISEQKAPEGYRFSAKYLANILFESLPRYVWRAQVYFRSILAMELIFDATDVPGGQYLTKVAFYNQDFREQLMVLLLENEAIAEAIAELFGLQFMKTFIESIVIPILEEEN